MKSFAIILVLAFSIAAQSSDLERGIDLYRNGNVASALVVLDKLARGAGKSDGRVWNYIGLSHLKMDDYQEAQNAFEKAVKLSPNDATIRSNYAFSLLLQRKTKKARTEVTNAIEIDPNNSAAYFIRATARFWDSNIAEATEDVDKALSIQPDFSAAVSLRADILMSRLAASVRGGVTPETMTYLSEAIRILEDCNRRCTDASGKAGRESRIAGLYAFDEYFRAGNGIESDDGPSEPGETKVKILTKPRPGYTDAARVGNVQGNIVILALFDVSGRVTQAMIVKPLGSGLDENALRATMLIRFEPATKDGKPIPAVKRVEYSFSIF